MCQPLEQNKPLSLDILSCVPCHTFCSLFSTTYITRCVHISNKTDSVSIMQHLVRQFTVTIVDYEFVSVVMPEFSGRQTISFLCCIILSSLAFLDLPYFSTLYQTVRFLEEKSLNIKWVFWFNLQRLPEILPILRRNALDIINVCTSSYKVPVVLLRL